MTVTPAERRRARTILDRLRRRYPVIRTALGYADPWQLLVATVLSAQTTDDTVNRVTPELFRRWPSPRLLAQANPEEVESVVFSTGFYRQKTRAVIELSADLADRFSGIVPDDLERLVTLKGVGRKTASVVLAEAFGLPAIAVDTHVSRVSRRLGLVADGNPVKVEAALKELYPEAKWPGISMRFIQFGRDTCIARRPRCPECILRDRCPYPDKTVGA
ncbi:MAG TPA: endonuclease III [Actinobacteria bacterium]|nr:endonuclease III [Actinomycetota bacterium]